MTLGAGAIQLLMDLRRAGISDTRMLAAVERTPRDAFATDPEGAWKDAAVPLGPDGFLSRPHDLVTMIAALGLGDRQRVLQIPTGTGYEAALLAGFCRWVYTVEPDRARRRRADERLRALGLGNVVSHTGDPLRGWPEQAPFDAILLTEGTAEVPAELLAQLRPGGVLVGPIGRDARFHPLLRAKRSETGVETEVIARTSAF